MLASVHKSDGEDLRWEFSSFVCVITFKPRNTDKGQLIYFFFSKIEIFS